jgi:DNA-binding PadR family transcriptional regulator
MRSLADEVCVARRTTQLLKGCTETMVLKLLTERPMHGYELMQEISARSDGVFALGQGTVYPLLYSLERKGLIKARWEEPREGTRRRKVYRLTGGGTAAFEERVAEWSEFVRGMSRVLGGTGA